MGWKGAVRSINAELNRQAREADKRHRAHLKDLERQEAFDIVSEQQEYFKNIISLHHECRANFDWANIKNEDEPKAPKIAQPLFEEAVAKLKSFKPNFVQKLLGLEDRHRKKLQAGIEKAKNLDSENFKKVFSNYEKNKREWDKKQALARRIGSNKEALIEAIKEYLDISDVPIGKSVNFEVSDDMKVDVNLKVSLFEEVIPSEEYSLRQSGTLSARKMAKGKSLELYQDHVCSSLLRVSIETLGILPIDSLRANALINGVNTETGHLEDQIIVSVIVIRDTLEKLNLKMVDPSDSLRNFLHNMNFKKTKGFSPVERIEISS